MKVLSGKELCRLLEGLSVPVHANKPLKKGLLHALLKIAEIA